MHAHQEAVRMGGRIMQCLCTLLLLTNALASARELNAHTRAVHTGKASATSIALKFLDAQRARQGNVRRYAIPGLITVLGGKHEAVLMHVYIRSQWKRGAVEVRGYMFAESVKRKWYSWLDNYICQPNVPQGEWPGITLREVHGEREHRLRVYSELIFGHQIIKLGTSADKYNRTCTSHPFSGKMPAEEASTTFRVAIDGFQKTAYYRPQGPRDSPGD